MTVTALLVNHDGARWLPAVLAGLAEQQHPPERIVAVDTGSTDGSVDLLVEAFGADRVLTHPGSFPEAVAHALAGIETEWVWLLHDDSRPAPGALGALLDAARRHDADVAGPKLREWPSLRRLLEVGVTVSGQGLRETGLERGEYDQGQHDKVREVLAVNTAGMLVRTDLLVELDGFDPQLPVFSTDVDFGWRVARAGRRTIVAPDAIVFHAEAATRGLRRTAATGKHHHLAERRAGIYTMLVNTSGRNLPWQWLRLVVGSLFRMLGMLLARSPRAAWHELVALLGVHAHPGRIVAARRARRDLGDPRGERVRSLLAPWWLPIRHAIDFVTDVGTAVVNQGRDAAERRRAARLAESGVVVHETNPDESEELAPDTSFLARLVTNPRALAGIAVFLFSLWAAREALGPLMGGALSPAPDSAGELWRLATEGWHEVGQGTDAPAPTYLLPIAFLGTLLLNSATAAVSLVFLVAVPVAGWGAWRFTRVVAELGSGQPASPWILAWATAAYAAVPAASGAWGQGRLGFIASAALLPWLAHAALGLFEPYADRRWRAGWRTGFLLALLTAFTPGAWPFILCLVLIVMAALWSMARDVAQRRSVWGPIVVTVLVPPLLLLPGAIGMLGHDIAGLFLEAGRVLAKPGPVDLLAGRFPEPSAPHWTGLLLLVPAVLALARDRTRMAVVGCWLVVALASVLTLVLSRITVDLPAGSTRPGLGFMLLVISGALIAAVAIAAHGLLASFSGASFSWRQPVAGVAAAAALVVPVGGLGWWVFDGDNLLERPTDSAVPAYMAQGADASPGHGVLMLEGDVETGFTWQVYRGDGITLGEDEVLALTGPDPVLNADVAELLSDPTPELIASLPDRGIDYVVLAAPADGQVAATLDAAPGLVQASSTDRATRAWQFDRAAPDDAISGSGPAWHPWLVAIQMIAFVVVAVLCGPARKEEAES
ncbi:glycosyltransferase family 2 protein [Nocardioides sp. AE5]|uniref:glycosyltransferase family 2 protein n=1 Tax=Nocardioides sp. AE5 TaxID=2962573 RepID=UPI0028826EC8|nr:glycosyltransferase family 2 protein [Nocardioides sp. AE5]MDT0201889.1 glycosyltransferase family 2 protein [Nocardioides sp. AE5]